MERNELSAYGVKWGVVIGIVYVILLQLRFSLGETNVAYYGLLSTVGFFVVLALLLWSGFALRKKMGGYIELKDAFKSMFYSVLILEFMYQVYSYIYIKFINPLFYLNFRNASEKFMVAAGTPRKDIDELLKAIPVNASRDMNVIDLLKQYFFYMAVFGVFAFLLALIVRKNRPTFDGRQNS